MAEGPKPKVSWWRHLIVWPLLMASGALGLSAAMALWGGLDNQFTPVWRAVLDAVLLGCLAVGCSAAGWAAAGRRAGWWVLAAPAMGVVLVLLFAAFVGMMAADWKVAPELR